MFRRVATAVLGVFVALLALIAPAAAQDDQDDIPDLVEEATGLVEDEIRLMHALDALQVTIPPPVWFTAILQDEPEPFGNRSTLVDQLTSVEQAAQNIRDILAGRNHQVSGSVEAVLVMQAPGVHQALRNGVPTTPVSLDVYRRAFDDLEQRLGQGFDPVPAPPVNEPAASNPVSVLIPAVAAGSAALVALPILLFRRRRRRHEEQASPTPAAGIDELELGRRLMTAPEPAAVGRLVIDHARQVTGTRQSALVELSTQGVPLVLAAEPAVFAAEALRSTPSWDQALDTGRLAVCQGPDGAGTRACLPIMAAGRVTAVLVLSGLTQTGPGALSPEVVAAELVPLDRLAPTIGTALEAAARFDDQSQAARSDGLTGLANRRRFDDDLQRSVPGWLATGMPVACAMVDIDHFKSINDQFGDQVGDMVLRRVAGVLEAAVRGDDIAYRYGGEEFSILLPGATREVARGVAERIRLAVAATVFSELGGSITVSVGVTTAAGVGSADLVRRADEALYDAKRSGRNRVVAR
ncbi:MAG: GGDEF domain-containing protein [Actinomycetia bacterium]|nr:GGDEF domain-containing protein [Actinomycetes bacterium]